MLAHFILSLKFYFEFVVKGAATPHVQVLPWRSDHIDIDVLYHEDRNIERWKTWISHWLHVSDIQVSGDLLYACVHGITYYPDKRLFVAENYPPALRHYPFPFPCHGHRKAGSYSRSMKKSLHPHFLLTTSESRLPSHKNAILISLQGRIILG